MWISLLPGYFGWLDIELHCEPVFDLPRIDMCQILLLKQKFFFFLLRKSPLCNFSGGHKL